MNIIQLEKLISTHLHFTIAQTRAFTKFSRCENRITDFILIKSKFSCGVIFSAMFLYFRIRISQTNSDVSKGEYCVKGENALKWGSVDDENHYLYKFGVCEEWNNFGWTSLIEDPSSNKVLVVTGEIPNHDLGIAYVMCGGGCGGESDDEDKRDRCYFAQVGVHRRRDFLCLLLNNTHHFILTNRTTSRIVSMMRLFSRIIMVSVLQLLKKYRTTQHSRRLRSLPD